MATLESACSSSHARHDETVAEARGKGKLPLAPGRAAPDPHLCTVSSVTDLLDRAGCSLAGWLCSRWERLLTGFAAALRLTASAAANLSSACSRHHAVQQVHMHPLWTGRGLLAADLSQPDGQASLPSDIHALPIPALRLTTAAGPSMSGIPNLPMALLRSADAALARES